jgi:hypothetical protein
MESAFTALLKQRGPPARAGRITALESAKIKVDRRRTSPLSEEHSTGLEMVKSLDSPRSSPRQEPRGSLPGMRCVVRFSARDGASGRLSDYSSGNATVGRLRSPNGPRTASPDPSPRRVSSPVCTLLPHHDRRFRLRRRSRIGSLQRFTWHLLHLRRQHSAPFRQFFAVHRCSMLSRNHGLRYIGSEHRSPIGRQ